MGDRLLKIAVIILASIDALMWELYSQSPGVALVWAAIAIGFAGWIMRDIRGS